MTALRSMVQDQGMVRVARSGDNLNSSCSLLVIPAAGARTLTVADLAGGLIQFTGLSAGVNFTTDTAANILAAHPWMDVGDSFRVDVSITTAFAGTLVAGTGVTLAGRPTCPASAISTLVFIKTSATTVTLNCF